MNKDNYFEDLKTQSAYILQGQDNTIEERAGFTQGPWQESEGEIYRGNDPICDIIDYHGSEIDKANARLIASAPAMHEVLAELLDTLELSKGYGFDEEYEQVREVLAKADGGAEG